MQKVFAEVGQCLQQIGGECPAGWIEMAGQRPSENHVASSDGCWLLPSPEVEQIREVVKLKLNPLRDTFINRLTGICLFTEYPSMEEECKSLRIALLDITKDERFLTAETEETMTLAILQRYREIAVTASPTVRNVFRELTQE